MFYNTNSPRIIGIGNWNTYISKFPCRYSRELFKDEKHEKINNKKKTIKTNRQ